MGICENIQFLSKHKGLPISHLEKELSFANGSIRRWNESSPSIDKVQKVADYFEVSIDFLNLGFDREIIDAVKSLAKTGKDLPYFPESVLVVLTPEIESLKKEYWDVPLDTEPIEMISLISETPLSVEFKNDLLNVFSRVKEKLNIGAGSDITTLAAHHDGDEWTEEELTDIERFKEFVRSKRNAKS